MSISRISLVLGMALAAPLALAATPVGHWTGKITMKAPTLPPNTPPAQKAAVTKMLDQMAKARVLIDFKANKTFTVSMNGMPVPAEQKVQKGNWSQKGNVVTTTQSKPGDRPQDMILSGDGKTLTLTLPGGQGKVVFVR